MTNPLPVWDPYCGAGPGPAEVLARWNLDTPLLALLAASAFVAWRMPGPGRGWRMAAVATLALAFVSPLCAWSSALFSARTAHHALLLLAAGPLFALGAPRDSRGLGLPAATAIQALLFWAWHHPSAYAWALDHDAVYWLMQACLLGSAVVFWVEVRRAAGLAAAGALLLTLIQTGLLGALLTFAPQPLYAPHLATTMAWGLTPLADQQLAGLLMWAPMGAAYLLAALARVWRTLEPRTAASA